MGSRFMVSQLGIPFVLSGISQKHDGGDRK